ncbi:SGNH/GDSL hydrolase family protein [Cohnella soli]|uniref:SGNH/GDSL hydrolase family protein n=1 Tax=Cohnella soli TaxID=425005 RepID=A0ABW0HQP4_9BACL
MQSLSDMLGSADKAFIVCMGDSITEQNEHTHGKLNYAGQFQEKLLKKFGRRQLVLNAGVSDDTTRGILERLDRDALRFRPNVVTLMIGMNDSLWGAGEVQQFKANLISIAEKVRSAGSTLILLTPNTIDIRLEENHIRNSYPLYIQAMREFSITEQVPLCDVYRAFGDRSEKEPNSRGTLMNDCIHPNEYGHDLMAETLFRFLDLTA